MKKSKGITLIALVITIIVLLILAGVTIATLTGDNGLIGKTGEAKNATEKSQEKEELEVAVLGFTDKRGNLDATKIVNGLNNDIKNLNSVTATDGKFPVKVEYKNGHKFRISENGDVNILAEWIKNENGSYTNSETKQIINIGDTVKYETILAKTENAVNSIKLTKLKSDLSAYSGDSSSTDNSSINRDSLTWKILDIKDEKIRLISTVPTTSQIRLYGPNGYNNAVYLLDKACDTLYSIDGVGKSQNLKIEDIEEKIDKTKFDYTQYANSSVDTKKYGGTKEYTSSLKYPNIYPREVGCKGIDGESGTNNNTGTLGLSEQITPVTGISTATSRIKATQTYWYKSMESTYFTDSKYYTLFINNGSNLASYWLSSRTIHCNANEIAFRIFRIDGGNVDRSVMIYSNDNYNGYASGFRPVVSLKPDVELSGNSTNGWTIQ